MINSNTFKLGLVFSSNDFFFKKKLRIKGKGGSLQQFFHTIFLGRNKVVNLVDINFPFGEGQATKPILKLIRRT